MDLYTIFFMIVTAIYGVLAVIQRVKQIPGDAPLYFFIMCLFLTTQFHRTDIKKLETQVKQLTEQKETK